MGLLASQKHLSIKLEYWKAHVQIIMWQQIRMAESTDSNQRSKSNSEQGKDIDILTICDNSKDEELGEMDTSATICVYLILYTVVSRCFPYYEMNIIWA